MKSCFFFFLLLPCFLFAQNDGKIEKLPFCGWRMNDGKKITQQLEAQFRFLNPQKGDTIVDIGAASGALEGCLAAGFNLNNVNFILVDVDARCLNETKVSNMRRHYSAVKGDSLSNGFEIVHNTPDSLFLPLNRYRKVWLMNTLHEVASPGKMAKDICSILQSGGELCVLEVPPDREGQKHGGCKMLLLKPAAIEAVFTSNGFRLDERKDISQKGSMKAIMYRFIKA